MANVIKTVLTYPLDGSNRDFNIPFEYLARKFVVVTLIGVDRKVLTINTDYRFATRTTISLTKAWGPADGYTTIELRRVTSTTDRLVDFTDGSILRAYDLNVAQIQTMHVAEEARDLTADTIGVNNDGHLDARGRRIVNVANGIDTGDAVNMGQLRQFDTSTANNADRAAASAAAAKQSELNAAASEARSVVAETKAIASAGTAMTAADEAKRSKTTAVAAKDRCEVILSAVEAASGPSVELVQRVDNAVAASQTASTNAANALFKIDEHTLSVGDMPSFSDVAVNKAAANSAAFGRLYLRNNIVIIGDSITNGVGASVVPEFAYAGLLAQSIANFYKDGYGYPLIRNIGPAQYIYTHNGTVGAHGLSGQSIVLNGQTQGISFYPSEALGVFLLVEPSVSNAPSIELVVNGVVVNTLQLTGQQDVAVIYPLAKGWTSADTVAVRPTSGTLVVTGATILKYPNGSPKKTGASPLVITNGFSGQSFEFYRSQKAQTAALSTAFDGSGSSTYILALGTNSIYNPYLAQTPDEYVSSMLGLESDLKALNPAIDVIFTIPPKAGPQWTTGVVKPNVTYEDYVKAIRAAVPRYKLIDLNIANLPTVDGIHPNEVGHIAMAQRFCSALNIPFNPEPPAVLNSVLVTGSSPVSIDGGYATRDKHGTVTLCGQVRPNGATTNLLTVLSADHRPRAVRYFTVPLIISGGYGRGVVQISPSGEVRMVANSDEWTEAYLDGITFN